MYNFFVSADAKSGDIVYITGTDYNHIKNVLRMKKGDYFLVSCNGVSSLCSLKEFTESAVIALIEEQNYQDTSLPIKIYLFQGLPKSDKMELIVQKAVELGVEEIIPVQMERCVVKAEGKKKDSKTARWQAISESAAKQSKRTSIPTVQNIISYKQALSLAKEFDLLIIPYENEKGMLATKEALSLIKKDMKIGVIIGPEGGFSDKEVQAAKDSGGKIISLGKRILRTETAAITALATLMIHIEMNL